tara:strand:+ start:381 stop:620 length:240 start_codon:yes stop_codon:yes gene_type:complete
VNNNIKIINGILIENDNIASIIINHKINDNYNITLHLIYIRKIKNNHHREFVLDVDLNTLIEIETWWEGKKKEFKTHEQ